MVEELNKKYQVDCARVADGQPVSIKSGVLALQPRIQPPSKSIAVLASLNVFLMVVTELLYLISSKNVLGRLTQHQPYMTKSGINIEPVQYHAYVCL